MSTNYVVSNETVKDVTLNSEESQSVQSGGTTIRTKIMSGGNQYIYGGGVASATKIYSSGSQGGCLGGLPSPQ